MWLRLCTMLIVNVRCVWHEHGEMSQTVIKQYWVCDIFFSCQLYKLMAVSSLLSVLIFNIKARTLLLFSNLIDVVVLGLCLSMFSKWDIFLVFEISVKQKSLTLKLKSDKGLQYDIDRADTATVVTPLVCIIQESYLNFYNSYFFTWFQREYLQCIITVNVNSLLLIPLSTRGRYCSKNLVHFNVRVWQTVLRAFTNYFFLMHEWACYYKSFQLLSLTFIPFTF